MGDDGSPLVYLRLYSDEIGESHFDVLTSGALEPHSAEASRFRQGSASEFDLRIIPSGWQRPWAPAARPTLAIYIAGEGTVEASDGDTRSVHSGVVLLAEDLTGRGHRALVGSDGPLAVMHVILPGLLWEP